MAATKQKQMYYMLTHYWAPLSALRQKLIRKKGTRAMIMGTLDLSCQTTDPANRAFCFAGNGQFCGRLFLLPGLIHLAHGEMHYWDKSNSWIPTSAGSLHPETRDFIILTLTFLMQTTFRSRQTLNGAAPKAAGRTKVTSCRFCVSLNLGAGLAHSLS